MSSDATSEATAAEAAQRTADDAVVATATTDECASDDAHQSSSSSSSNDNNDSDDKDSDDSSNNSSSDDEDVELDYHFANDEEALTAREAGLRAYNAGRYGDALDQQYRVVRYFAEKYGATAAPCGVFFLDYGLSQLRTLQAQSGVDAVLSPRDQEALETCYINLEVARVCLQKRERECQEALLAATTTTATTTATNDGASVDTHGATQALAQTRLSLAEVHNALGQLNAEKEDYDAALREYEAELLIYREMQQEQQQTRAAEDFNKNKSGNNKDDEDVLRVLPRRVIAVLYSIADCYMKEADFDGAATRLRATLDELATYPAHTIEPELVSELRDVLADAEEMRNGTYKELREAIAQQFAPEAEQMPTAQEFYAVGGDDKHPYLSALPGGAGEEGNEASHLSMPVSANGQVLGLREHSNSQSISLFPRQGSRSGMPPAAATTAATTAAGAQAGATSGSTEAAPAAVQYVVARKKPKPATATAAARDVADEPACKRVRAE